MRDALIGTSAAAYAEFLVTHDDRLAKRVKANSSTAFWTCARFSAYIDTL